MKTSTEIARLAVEEMSASEEAAFLKWLRKRAPEPDMLNLAEEWWFEKLKSGVLLPGRDGWPRTLPSAELSADYIACAGDHGMTLRGNQGAMGSFLQKVCPPIYSRSRKLVGMVKRGKVYIMPSLEVARECWDECRDDPVNWDAADGSAPEGDSDAAEVDSPDDGRAGDGD